MILLSRYFSILFLDKNLSREHLKQFTEDHIQRLTGNNPGGVFSTILTNVTTAYNNYYGDMASESLNLAVQEGKTAAMNSARTLLQDYISDAEGLIAYTYRNANNTYIEFFPQGLTEYITADLPTFETITLRFKNVVAAHSADFTTQFVTDITTLQGNFVAARHAQQSAMGSVSAERSDMESSKPALAVQLTYNVVTIALHFLGNESKAGIYFNQSILGLGTSENASRVEDDINPGETLNAFDNITTPDLQLHIINRGSGALHVGFTDTADGAITGADFEVPPGGDITKPAAELGYTDANLFLNVTNNGTIMGSFTIEKM